MVFLRVISGKYKGKQLKGFDIEGTRPTMDRVKESLFALIQKEVKQSICLDLFAGSGSLGIEALSNGADSCFFVEKNKQAFQVLKSNTKEIEGATILECDAFQIHKKTKQKFNLVFLDPPYHELLINKALSYLLEHHLLEQEAIIVCESEEEIVENSSFKVLKEKKYGKKHIKIIKLTNK